MPSSIVYIPFDDNLWQVRITLDKASNEGKDPEKEWFNDYDIFVSGGIIESSLSEVRQKPVKSLFEACLFEPNRVLPFDFSLIGAAAHIFKRYNSSSLNPGEIIPQYFNPPQAEDNTVLQRMIK
ncbi:MAG: hypothetical protein NT001_03500 [Candidatus Woesearchaeota archaeon]|nr:hypothetical protein [Candidatus Woesearchaeota archaeon]